MRAVHFASIAATAAALTAMAQPAAAQVQDAIPLTITFDGTVSNSIENDIDHYGFDFDVSLPAFPYQQGDPISFTIETLVPTQQALLSGDYDYALQDDGTFRFELFTDYPTMDTEIGHIQSFDASGPINQVPIPLANQTLPFRTIDVVIDPTDNHYSLYADEFWRYSTFDAPGYRYDAASGTFTLVEQLCQSLDCERYTRDHQRLTSLSWTEVLLTTRLFSDDLFSANISLPLIFTGEWSLPIYEPSGDPTPVPEPGMLLLFGAGAAAVFQRRRKKARKQAA